MISIGKGFDRNVLLLFIAFQALVCYNFYIREIAWYPPGNYDQTYYLMVAYRTQERVLTNGFGQLLRLVGSGSSTGLALETGGTLSGLVLGGARLPQLLLNFLSFCVLQVVAFATARGAFGSRAYSYMLLGLILCQITPWYWAGGMFDFRFDFVAYCLYGVWICAAIRSKLFFDRRWAIACGLIGALLVLTRFLTIVYLLGISAGFAGLCAVVGFLWQVDSDLARRMRERLYNLAISVGVLVVIVAPFFIRSWAQIFWYYGFQHVLGAVKNVRAHQLGNDTLTEHLLFYPNSILRDQWGPVFLLGSAIALMGTLIARIMNPAGAPNAKASRQEETFLLQIIFLLGAILGPIVVLTVDTDKSPMVSSIVGVPAALLVVVLAARAASIRELGPSPIRKSVIACSLAIFPLGVASEFDHLSRHLPEYTQRRDLKRLVELNKWLVNYASEHGWVDPGISFDVLSPWLYAPGITCTGYEKLGLFVEFHRLLGDSMGVERQEALSLLEKSDFLILTTQGRTGLGPARISPAASSDAIQQFPNMLSRLNPLSKHTAKLVPSGISLEGSTAALQRFPTLRLRLSPFDEHISQYWNDLKSWADMNMILAKTVLFDNFAATVYVRPTGTPSSPSPGAQ